jgi:hypothetical protein
MHSMPNAIKKTEKQPRLSAFKSHQPNVENVGPVNE